jgi:hypothetical protein
MAVNEEGLLALVADRGRAVSPRMLRRWRAEGLVPPPAHIHDPGSPGSRSEYDDDTAEQVAAVAELMTHRRSVPFVAIELWWAGRWVNETILRAALTRPFVELAARYEEIVAKHGDDLHAAAEEIADEAEKEAARGRGWGLIGTRIGRGRPLDRRRLVLAFAQVQLGLDPAWRVREDNEIELDQLFARGTGFERAATDRLVDGQPWLDDLPDFEEQLDNLTSAGPRTPQEAIDAVRAASSQEL